MLKIVRMMERTLSTHDYIAFLVQFISSLKK